MWTPNAATLRLQAIKAGKNPRESETKKAITGKKEPGSDQKAADSGKKPNKKAPGKRIKTRSKKQAKTMRILKKLYPPFLEARPLCEIKTPVCTGVATCVNHDRGRGANVLNQDDWTPACTACNGWIEEHHAWAEERGFKKRRHGNKK